MKPLNILCVGDIVGKPGRKILQSTLAQVQKEHNIHFTIVNAENSAGGFGLTTKIYNEILELNVQALTSGNHIYDQRQSIEDIPNFKKLVRPINFPEGCPGVGARIYKHNTLKIGIINAIGRVFMHQSDCPFKAVQKAVEAIQKETPIIIVDFHAETTSEKIAMGWFLDGKTSLVYGTHTHVQTADDRLLDQGTAYISDIGMTGPADGILGMERGSIIQKFLDGMPTRFEPCTIPRVALNGIKVTIDSETGKAVSIERISVKKEG